MKNNIRYITNSNGKTEEVILSVKDFEKMLKDLEELDSIRAFDTAKASKDEVIPFEQAVREIEQSRT